MQKMCYYCSFCNVRIEGDDPVIWRNEKPYHKHHAKHHNPEKTVVIDKNRFSIVPRMYQGET